MKMDCCQLLELGSKVQRASEPRELQALAQLVPLGLPVRRVQRVLDFLVPELLQS